MTKETDRNKYIDVLRGIGIISIVLGHVWNTDNYFSVCGEMLRRFVYLYHLPVFFFCAGYMFRVKTILEFCMSVLKNQYLKFVIVGLTSLMLAPVWSQCGIITSVAFEEIKADVWKIIKFYPSGILTGTMWFVPMFAIALTIFYMINYLAEKVIAANVKFSLNVVKGVVFLLLGLCGMVLTVYKGWGNHFLHVSLTMLPVMYLGQYMKQKPLLFERVRSVWLVGVSGTAMVFLVFFTGYEIELSKLKLFNDWAFYPVILLGILFCVSLASWIERFKISQLVAYCGKMSFWIMAYQLIAIKVVDAIAGNILHVDQEILQLFPYSFNSVCIKVIYFLAGMCIPLAVGNAVIWIKGCMLDWRKHKE